MSTVQSLLDKYGESHQNHTNKTIHWICVPLIVMSLLGLLWAIPTPAVFDDIGGGWINWATIFATLTWFYYVSLSPQLAVGMILVVGAMVVGIYLLAQGPLPIWLVSLIIFAGSWVGQFIGHKIEGKKPSFLDDVKFLLIGPLWLMHFIYRKVGISY